MGAGSGAKQGNQLGSREAAVLSDDLAHQVRPTSNPEAAATGKGGQIHGGALWVGFGGEVEPQAAVVVVSWIHGASV